MSEDYSLKAQAIVQEARRQGVNLWALSGRLWYAPAKKTPPQLLALFRRYEVELREYLVAERRDPPVLREWRRVSIPEWRHVLQNSIQRGDVEREEYARWMLREVLLDPEYREPEP